MAVEQPPAVLPPASMAGAGLATGAVCTTGGGSGTGGALGSPTCSGIGVSNMPTLAVQLIHIGIYKPFNKYSPHCQYTKIRNNLSSWICFYLKFMVILQLLIFGLKFMKCLSIKWTLKSTTLEAFIEFSNKGERLTA